MGLSKQWPIARYDTTVSQWLEINKVQVKGGKALLYKAVDNDLHSSRSKYHSTWSTGYTSRMAHAYRIGDVITAPDFVANRSCGAGLHLSTSPAAAKTYFQSATRFLEVEVDVRDINVLHNSRRSGPKCKVRSLRVIREVKLDYDPSAKVVKPLVGQNAVSRKSGFTWDVLHEEDDRVVMKRANSNKYKIVKVSNLKKSFSLV